MSRKRSRGVSDLVLMAQVARQYYLAGRSKVEIAAEVGLSRFRVARLIEEALERGVVRIEVGLPGDVDLGLSAELREVFDLLHCIVVDAPDETEETLRHHVGSATAQLLGEIVSDEDVLGVSTTRVLMGLSTPVAHFARCPVVQITGALSRPDAEDVIDAVRRLTRVGGGPAYVFYAPLVCRDAQAYETYQHQPDVARCQELFDDVTVSVTGVGAWQPGLSTVHDAVPPADRDACRDLGITTETGGILVDEHGDTIPTPLTGRLLGMRGDQLRHVPTRVGVVYDARKAASVRTALESRLINALVTHRSLAEAVLNGATAV